jgi:hypothetical protein
MAITLTTVAITDKFGKDHVVMSNQVENIQTDVNGDVNVFLKIGGDADKIIETENVASTGSVSLDSGAGTITDLTVDGVSIFDTSTAIPAEADTTAGREAQAHALAVAINNYASTPEYTATVAAEVVTIVADKSLADSPNTLVVASTTTGTLSTTDGNMAGGTDEKAVLEALLNSDVITVNVSTGTQDLDVFKIEAIDEDVAGTGCFIYYTENNLGIADVVACTETVAAVKAKIDAL